MMTIYLAFYLWAKDNTGTLKNLQTLRGLPQPDDSTLRGDLGIRAQREVFLTRSNASVNRGF